MLAGEGVSGRAARGLVETLHGDEGEVRLAERVEHALHGTGYGALRGIEVTVHARLVILGGRVPSYHMKQVAQTTALAVPGAHHVRNNLEVGQLS